MSHPFRFSDASSLALHSMALMADNKDSILLNTKNIAEVLKVSKDHLSKVLIRLTHNGLVRARRGPAGGFELAHPADSITLKNIYEAVEGPLAKPNCFFNIPVCGKDLCKLNSFASSIARQVIEKLEETKLSEIKLSISVKEK